MCVVRERLSRKWTWVGWSSERKIENGADGYYTFECSWKGLLIFKKNYGNFEYFSGGCYRNLLEFIDFC